MDDVGRFEAQRNSVMPVKTAIQARIYGFFSHTLGTGVRGNQCAVDFQDGNSESFGLDRGLLGSYSCDNFPGLFSSVKNHRVFDLVYSHKAAGMLVAPVSSREGERRWLCIQKY